MTQLICYVFITGTQSKIFNEIDLNDNRLLTLHDKCIYRMSMKRDIVMQLIL